MNGTDAWWMVGCDGSVPHFYQGRGARNAVAKFRANLIEMEREANGLSIKDATFVVRGLRPEALQGPMTAKQAYDLDLGWLWAIAVCDGYHGTPVNPTGPLSREDAVERLGKDRVERMERGARRFYGLTEDQVAIQEREERT